MSGGVSAALFEQALRAAIGPLQQLDVINESHLHAGHAGAGEGSHWRVKITGDCMHGLPRVARHRLSPPARLAGDLPLLLRRRSPGAACRPGPRRRADRRARQLQLTPDGSRLLARCRPVVEALQADILAPLSDADRAAFLVLARRALSLG